MAPKGRRVFLVLALVAAVLLAGVASSFASGSPDGLERVASDTGFLAQERPSSASDGPLAGYRLRGLHGDRLATGAAGVIGVALTAVVGGGLVVATRAARRRSRVADDASRPAS